MAKDERLKRKSLSGRGQRAMNITREPFSWVIKSRSGITMRSG